MFELAIGIAVAGLAIAVSSAYRYYLQLRFDKKYEMVLREAVQDIVAIHGDQIIKDASESVHSQLQEIMVARMERFYEDSRTEQFKTSRKSHNQK